ncbi:MAG: hypothetical protein V1899_01490 [Planctomycetota bacterium]
MMALGGVVVVIIVATLLAFSVFVKHTRSELTRSNLKEISSALNVYYDQHQTFPAAFLKGTGFGYVKDCRMNCPQDIQVFERAAASGDRYVLLVDGTIRLMNELEFQQMAREQAKTRQQTTLPIFEVCPVILDRRKIP